MPREPNEHKESDEAISPEATDAVLASVPDVLKNKLRATILRSEKEKSSTLISSNTLANHFIYEKWGIRASQRRRYRNLFTQVRRQCRDVFRHFLRRGWLEIRDDATKHTFGVYQFDDKRGNLILGFVKVNPETEWHIRHAGG
jgi:hypothetical protein